MIALSAGSWLLATPFLVANADLVNMSLAQLLEVEVISASKTTETAERAPATIYVISREQIDKLGLTSLKEVLALVPGVDTVDNDFFLQGGQRGFMGPFSQSLLLIDGREMNNLIAGETFIANQFRTHHVKRVEIIAGPGSALYGANAVGGVINVITREDGERNPPGATLGLNLASHTTRQFDLRFNGEYLGWKYSGSAAWYASEGEDFSDFLSNTDLASPAAENNAYRHLPNEYGYANKSTALPLSVFLEKDNLYMGMEYYQNTSGRGTASIEWDYNDGEDFREMAMGYFGIHYRDWLEGRLQVRAESRHYWERFWGNHTNSTGPLENPYTGETLTDQATRADVEAFRGFYSNRKSRGSRRHVYEVESIYRPDTRRTWIAGAVGEYRDIIAAVWSRTDDRHPRLTDAQQLPMFNHYRWGVYGQYQQQFWRDRLTVTLGARLAGHQYYDAKLLPRGGLVARPFEDTTLKLLYGKSFREPSVFESAGNPAIQPMEMDTWEFAWHQRLGRYFRNEAVVFFNEAKDRIVANNVTFYANDGTFESQGFENQLRFQWRRWQGFVNYTYMDRVTTSQIGGAPHEVRDIPRHKANLGVIVDLKPKLSLGVTGRYRGEVDTDYQGTVRELDEYLAWDVNLRYDALPGWDRPGNVSLRMTNVFDATYYHPEPRDANSLQHPQAGRALWLRLELGL